MLPLVGAFACQSDCRTAGRVRMHARFGVGITVPRCGPPCACRRRPQRSSRTAEHLLPAARTACASRCLMAGRSRVLPQRRTARTGGRAVHPANRGAHGASSATSARCCFEYIFLGAAGTCPPSCAPWQHESQKCSAVVLVPVCRLSTVAWSLRALVLAHAAVRRQRAACSAVQALLKLVSWSDAHQDGQLRRSCSARGAWRGRWSST